MHGNGEDVVVDIHEPTASVHHTDIIIRTPCGCNEAYIKRGVFSLISFTLLLSSCIAMYVNIVKQK